MLEVGVVPCKIVFRKWKKNLVLQLVASENAIKIQGDLEVLKPRSEIFY